MKTSDPTMISSIPFRKTRSSKRDFGLGSLVRGKSVALSIASPDLGDYGPNERVPARFNAVAR